MSATVTYKGATLTTVNNETKTLETAGTYLEDDITIVDSTGGGSAIAVTTETLPNGGDHVIITGVDLSNDTVTPETLLSGVTAHDASGQAIVGTASGGGGITAETGTITLTSDFALSTSPQNIPGLQLGFKPDFFFILIDRTSFTAKSSPGAGLYSLMAYNRSWSPPFASSSTATPETVNYDYTFLAITNVTANSSISTGYGLGMPTAVGTSYYSRFLVNDNGTISIGRYSTATTYMRSGTYRYYAYKL